MITIITQLANKLIKIMIENQQALIKNTIKKNKAMKSKTSLMENQNPNRILQIKKRSKKSTVKEKEFLTYK